MPLACGVHIIYTPRNSGSILTGELLVVVYAEHDDETRLISARRATRKERNRYET